MILEMIILTTHDETTQGVTEGQVLDDSKNTKFTKEDGKTCQYISKHTLQPYTLVEEC